MTTFPPAMGTTLIAAAEGPHDDAPQTLGDLLFTGKSGARIPESEWAELVQDIAAGDKSALHGLYKRSHRIVFTLIMRIAGNRETAEELTLDVFHDVWRRAPQYDPANGPVLGWIMNQARSRAIDRCDMSSAASASILTRMIPRQWFTQMKVAKSSSAKKNRCESGRQWPR